MAEETKTDAPAPQTDAQVLAEAGLNPDLSPIEAKAEGPKAEETVETKTEEKEPKVEEAEGAALRKIRQDVSNRQAKVQERERRVSESEKRVKSFEEVRSFLTDETQDPDEQLIRVIKAAGADPKKVLDRWVDKYLKASDSKPDAMDEVKKLKKELADRDRKIEERDRQQAEAKERSEKTEEIASFVKENAARWPLASRFDAKAVAGQVIENYLASDGTKTVDELMDDIETYLQGIDGALRPEEKKDSPSKKGNTGAPTTLTGDLAASPSGGKQTQLSWQEEMAAIAERMAN